MTQSGSERRLKFDFDDGWERLEDWAVRFGRDDQALLDILIVDWRNQAVATFPVRKHRRAPPVPANDIRSGNPFALKRVIK